MLEPSAEISNWLDDRGQLGEIMLKPGGSWNPLIGRKGTGWSYHPWQQRRCCNAHLPRLPPTMRRPGCWR